MSSALPAQSQPVSPATPLPSLPPSTRPVDDPAHPAASQQPRGLSNSNRSFQEIHLEDTAGSWSRVALSPDGKTLVGIIGSHEFAVWDTQTGKKRLAFTVPREVPGSLTSFDFSPDNTTLALAYANGRVLFLDTQTGLVTNSLRITNISGTRPLFCVISYFPDGERLAATDAQGNASVWHIASKNKLAQWSLGIEQVNYIRVSPDNNTIVTCGMDSFSSNLRLWSPSGQLIKIIATDGRAYMPVFSPDGKILAGSNRGGRVFLWNLQGNVLRSWTFSHPLPFSVGAHIAFAHNGSTTVAGYRTNRFGSVQLNATETGEMRGEIPVGSVNSLAISRDGSLLAVVSPALPRLSLWNLNGNSTMGEIPLIAGPGQRPVIPGILFHSNRDGNDEIYAMNSDGTTVRRLTNNPANDGGVVIRANNTLVAFTSNRDGNLEIYRINSDGLQETRLTNHPGSDIVSSWHRDGRIAFYSNRDGNYNIYTMNEDGDTLVRLTDDRASDIHPAFSPDGQRIAFASNRSRVYEIYAMGANGNNVVRLTSSPMSDREPAWSPDGKKIVWTRREGENNENIYIMNADGTDQKCLTEDNAKDVRATFSADGSKIIFASDRDGTMNIYSMEINGSNVTRLTSNKANSLDPYAGTIQAVAP